MRLFVALDPPEGARCALLSLLKGLELPPHRVTPVGQLHMTLVFLGDTRAKEVREVVESLERSASGIAPFALAPRRLITLPRGEHPRLVAVTTDQPPALAELQSRLARRLVRPVERGRSGAFLPHLTLCRFSAPGSVSRDIEARTEPFDVEYVTLYKSDLGPGGAVHTAVHAVTLSEAQ